MRDADGVFLARVDLAYPELRIAIEYDGVWHADRAPLRRDRRRLNALVGEGWVVFHVTAADLHGLDELVRRVRRLLDTRQIGKWGSDETFGPRLPGARATG